MSAAQAGVYENKLGENRWFHVLGREWAYTLMW